MNCCVSDIYAEKPNYNVGSAVKLSFAKKENTNKSTAAAVWKLTDDGDDDDLINEDDLLDESDKIKPNPTELRGKFINLVIASDTGNHDSQHLSTICSLWHNWETKGMQRLFLWIG